MKYKQYTKIPLPKNCEIAVAAIYEPHPFRSGVISEAIEQSVDTGVRNDECCWVYYDWCGNPIGIGDEMPEGIIVERFTAENLGCPFKYPPDKENYERLAEYLNKEYWEEQTNA